MQVNLPPADPGTSIDDGARIFARVMEYQGKTRREVVNPCLTARECIALANYIATQPKGTEQDEEPVPTRGTDAIVHAWNELPNDLRLSPHLVKLFEAVKTCRDVDAPAQSPAPAPEARALIEQCRDALAEELAAWDIDPPLHHVKTAHDACVAWLEGQAPAVAHALPPGLRRAAERTREDLGTNGTNYPDVRELLAFAEAAIQAAAKPPVQGSQP